MPPKAKSTDIRWKKADDLKLLELIKQERNGITHSRSKENIIQIHKHWPHRDWKGFAALIRPKLEKWEIEGILAGQRKLAGAGEFELFCIQFISYYTHSCCIFVCEAQDVDSSEDESYNNSDRGNISLGSNNTIDGEELEDIKEDAESMPTPKPRKSKPPISAKNVAPISIAQLVTDFDSVNLT